MDGQLYMPDGSETPQVLGGRYLKDSVNHTTATRQSRQPSTQPPPHIMAGILSAAYLETPVVININLSTFVMIELKEEEDETPTATIPDFQPYIAQAWASFQADKAARNKEKQVRFDGIQVPL